MTPFESSHKSQMRGMSRLNVRRDRGPNTESDDPKLTGTRCQMAIEHTDGSERFARPETRREGTEA